MARLGGTPRMLPDQPVATVDPEVERLAHVMVDGLIERLAAEPAVPATSLLDNLAEQLQQAANLRRLNVRRRLPGSASAISSPATPRRAAPRTAPGGQSPRPVPGEPDVAVAAGRWSQYTQLSKQVKQAGLLDRRRGWYAAKIGVNLLLLAAGLVAFAMLGESWWQLLVAAYLAVVSTQLAFVGHDAGHRQLFRSRRANDLVGLAHANLGVGVSFDWWVAKHNRHHTNPNHEDLDPDISITALAFTPDQARSKHGLVRLIARYQAWLFFPLLLLEAAHLHLASANAILRSRGRGRANTIEALLLLIHVAGYLGA